MIAIQMNSVIPASLVTPVPGLDLVASVVQFVLAYEHPVLHVRVVPHIVQGSIGKNFNPVGSTSCVSYLGACSMITTHANDNMYANTLQKCLLSSLPASLNTLTDSEK